MPILATLFAAAAGMGFLLGLINLLVWQRLPERREFLCASLMGFSSGVIAICELSQLHSTTPVAYQRALELQIFSVAVMLFATIWFVRFRLGSGRLWLMYLIMCIWGFSLLVSGFIEGNIAFQQVFAVERLSTPWGESYSLPEGILHPLAQVPNIASLAIFVFVLDAILLAARQGTGRLAVQVGGPILVFMIVAGIHTPLVDAGIVRTPYVISLIFLAISLSLAIGLVNGVAQAAAYARQIETQRRRWQMLQDEIDLAVLRISPDGRLAYINPFLERLCQRTDVEVVGASPAILFGKEAEREIETLARGVPPWTSRAGRPRAIHLADGSRRELVWFSAALTDENRKPDGMISFGQDVTEQLAVKAERDATLLEMEKMTRAITLGELASTFAHELSQPIAAVLSSAQTLELRWRDGPDQADDLKVILDRIIFNTRRARDLMNRVRGFMYARDLTLSDVDLRVIAEDALGIVEPEARRLGAAIRIAETAGPVSIRAVKLELQQVLVNLLLNAVQALEGRKDGCVEIGWTQSDHGETIVRVDDNGPGLSDAQASTIFEPFFTSKDTGNGIGLSVVRRIVTRHQGEVLIERSPLGGAAFCVRLPPFVEEASQPRARNA